MNKPQPYSANPNIYSESGGEFLPPFYMPHRAHSNRRAKFHNYKAPGMYMITISKDPLAPPFSSLCGIPGNKENPPRAILSREGRVIEDEILGLNDRKEFEVNNYVVMPDHVHIMWRVKEWLIKDLGYHIGLFKSRCSKDWHELYATPNNLSLFAPKFNDRIAFDGERARRLDRYVSDNPRRRLMAILYPDLFKRAHKVRIGDQVFEVFGNFQLLRHPLLSTAIVSSRYTEEEQATHNKAWEETIRGGGVFISPFISEAERGLRDRLLAENGSIIRIVADGIGPRYKPSEREFALCEEGRCLHIGLPRESMHIDKLKRDKCLALNSLARWIADNPEQMMSLLRD